MVLKSNTPGPTLVEIIGDFAFFAPNMAFNIIIVLLLVNKWSPVFSSTNVMLLVEICPL
jgi:hypothetical protein